MDEDIIENDYYLIVLNMLDIVAAMILIIQQRKKASNVRWNTEHLMSLILR